MSPQNNLRALLGNRVFPITVSTPFAVGDVYSYLIKDDKIVLVDCGQKTDTAYAQIKDGLKKQGLEIKDIDEIWLTHGHPDHFGQAALLAETSGAVVKGHAKERSNFAGNSDPDLFEDFFSQHDIPPERIDEMLNQLDWLQQYQEAIEPEWITEKDELCSGRLTFHIKHAPGHAPGHVVFYERGGLIFGGDVLLEHISTNALINFDPDTGTRNKSLLQYRQSLQWMKNLDGLILPGHGKQIENITRIAKNHLIAQQERYHQIIDILQQQSYALYELCRVLFPDALQRGEHFLVLSEVLGYLDWGIEEGIIRKEKGRKAFIFLAE